VTESKCRRCGASVRRGYAYCAACGASQLSSSGMKRAALVLAAVLVVGVVLVTLVIFRTCAGVFTGHAPG
jgi:hypothetical protein